jgi:hypothetical protein
MGEVQRDGGLARAALEVGDGGADRAGVLRAEGHEALAVDLEPAADRVDLLERVPALAAVLLDEALGQGGVGGEAAAQGGLVHLEDQLAHLPGGEAAQLLLVLGRVGLLPDPALHLQRLRLEAGEVGMGVHACSCPFGDVNSCLIQIYADFARKGKSEYHG